MRMTRFIVALVVITAAVSLAAAPASAQNTYFALRYWSTSTNVSLTGGPKTRIYDTNMVSLSVRRSFATDWALSFNLDTGAQRNWNPASTWATATAGTNTNWNVNLHRTFSTSNAMASVFGGYFSTRTASTFGTSQESKVSGLRIGGDLLWQAPPWSVMGWAALGISPQGTSSQPGFVTSQGAGTYSEYGALVGYRLRGNWNLEGGYRWLNFGVPAGGSFTSAKFDTSGWTVGLSVTMP